MKVVENYTNDNGVEITIFENDIVNLKYNLDSETDTDISFASELEAVDKLGCTLEEIDGYDLIDYINTNDLYSEEEEFLDDLDYENFWKYFWIFLIFAKVRNIYIKERIIVFDYVINWRLKNERKKLWNECIIKWLRKWT